MSKFDCRCGYVIGNTSYPATHEGNLVTDMELDDGQIKHPNDVMSSRSVMECPECYRIWIQVGSGNKRYIPFKPEDGPLKLAEQQGGYRG